MTALLDKLKVNGKASDPVSRAGHRGESPESSSLPSEATLVSSAASDDLATPPPLEETQASDGVATRSMTFTYPPGSTPLPRYTIRRGIGMGGFGEVYFAVSEAGKEVALKRIQRNLEVEIRGVSHCLNLKHPNLVSLYDICRDDNNQSWVVMEYVAGPNLRQVLDESPGGLPESEVRRWFHAIAEGVNHLHSAGLVHRDLKPGNVFDDLGMIKVGDYGLSKFISASHRGGHTESVGTFHYMAPEIGRGEYGREIDIYAMGILLYELLTGQVPFDGESCHEIIVKHLTATPDLSNIAQPYRDTIARCLEKDPARRYSTISEMMAALGGNSLAAGTLPPTPPRQVAAAAPVTATAVESEQPIHATVLPDSPVGSMPPRQAPTPPVSRPNDEPFARAVRHSINDLNRWWATLDRSPGAKAFLLIVAAFVLVVNTHWLLPLLSVVAFFYVPYYIVRQMVLHVRQQPTYAEAQRIATTAGVSRRPITRSQWRNHMRTDLRAKRSVHRVAELNTSWVAATLTALGMSLGTAVIGLRDGTVDAVAIAPYGWMAMIVLIASLGLLGMGKLWERDEGEGLPRRLVLAGVGAGVGLAAYSIGNFLMLSMDGNMARDVNSTSLPQSLYDANGAPLASAMMAHFALLFAMLRWWKPVDPLRRTRLSLWAVAVAVVAEWVVHQVLPIPQPAGMLMAGGIAIAVQMAAPWINPRTVPPPTGPRDNQPANDPTVASRSVA
ncbi:MAG: serine/threonine protein kinase [Pirellulales bacterium]|nr:serine/threonine protein kinase [Pirellulales bacterium]